jgi:hypothetical protein
MVLKVICKVLLSIIQKRLLYEEAINKDALFYYYANIYIFRHRQSKKKRLPAMNYLITLKI